MTKQNSSLPPLKYPSDTAADTGSSHISAAVREASKKLNPLSRQKLLNAADRGPVRPPPDTHPRFVK